MLSLSDSVGRGPVPSGRLTRKVEPAGAALARLGSASSARARSRGRVRLRFMCWATLLVGTHAESRWTRGGLPSASTLIYALIQGRDDCSRRAKVPGRMGDSVLAARFRHVERGFGQRFGAPGPFVVGVDPDLPGAEVLRLLDREADRALAQRAAAALAGAEAHRLLFQIGRAS